MLERCKSFLERTEGKNFWLMLLRRETEQAQPRPLFLDFDEIEVATASYLRESVLAFRDILRARRSTAYLAIVNANDNVPSALAELVRSLGGVLVRLMLTERRPEQDSWAAFPYL